MADTRTESPAAAVRVVGAVIADVERSDETFGNTLRESTRNAFASMRRFEAGLVILSPQVGGFQRRVC